LKNVEIVSDVNVSGLKDTVVADAVVKDDNLALKV